MKTLYPKHVAAQLRNPSRGLKKSLLFFLFLLLAALSFAAGPLLSFKNAQIESGSAGQLGTIYRFSSVLPNVDALVKIQGRSSGLVSLVTIDMVSSGFDKAWQPQVSYNNGTAPSAADWWMDFEISFVTSNTTTPVTVSDFDLSAIDIDGNGQRIHEYVSFYGLNSYTLETNTVLAVSDITGNINGNAVNGKRFDGPTANFANIDTNGTAVMVTTQFVNSNVFVVRAGGVSSGNSGASDRMYSFYFKDFTYTQPQQAILPVELKSFNATLNSGRASLNWVSAQEIALSHYTVERSYDGKTFLDAGMIFANGNSSTDIGYSYSEGLEGVGAAMVYYRLKMVDQDGTVKYSQVRILRLNNNSNNIAISAYPNPVASELRITIPAGWQDKKVVYEMFNSFGQAVKRFERNRASQTETVTMSDVSAGTYVIRLRSGDEMAVQRIVKGR